METRKCEACNGEGCGKCFGRGWVKEFDNFEEAQRNPPVSVLSIIGLGI